MKYNKLIDEVRQFLCDKNYKKILVALSGGADSVCLLHILKTLEPEFDFEIYAAHVNHMLRNKESNRDEVFVLNLCKKWNIECFSKCFDISKIAKENKESIETAARNVRYSFFEILCKKHGIDALATAHHLDDNIETVLMHFIRGSGLKGLSGISEVNNKGIIRPLINITRDEILNYISENNLEYVVDSTNNQTIYHRNSIRHELIPVLLNYNPNFKKSLSRNIKLYKASDTFIQSFADAEFDKLVKKDRYGLSFNLSDLKEKDEIIRYYIIARAVKESANGFVADAERIFDIDKCLFKEHTNISVGKHLKVYVLYDRVYFVLEKEKDENIYPLYLNKELNIKGAGITFVSALATSKNNKKNCIYLSRKKIEGKQLYIRFKDDGDCFYPAGFGHKKSLQDFFVDNKIPSFMRESIPLLLVEDEIVWVCGYRADERFVADDGEKDLIEIKFTEDK